MPSVPEKRRYGPPYRDEVYQQRFGADGKPTGKILQVNTHRDLAQRGSETVALKDGGWVVVWGSEVVYDRRLSWEIYRQRYSKTGDKVGKEVKVQSASSGSAFPDSAAALTDGGWIVTWVVTWVVNFFKGMSDGPNSVYQQRYDANGKAIGAVTLVNAGTSSKDKQFWYDPAIAALPDGGWVTVWAANTGTGLDIYQQRFSASGSKVGEQLLVNTYKAGGKGNDTYIVDDAKDKVVEAAGEGTDLVKASVSWTLGTNVENLPLTGSKACCDLSDSLHAL